MNPLTNAPVPPGTAADPADQVTALYQAHALGLLRLAVIMLGERQAAEDVVQDAFLGLFRRWGALNDPERALAYVRSSVFNGCRTVLRKRARSQPFMLAVDPEALPAYFVAISGLADTGQTAIKAPQAGSVIVGETLTGKRLGTVVPPAGGTFVGVAGAADDRTFVLDSIGLASGPGVVPATQQRTWFLLKITPGATPGHTLTRLDFPVPGGADINGIALSPDGSKLAVLYQVARPGDGFPYSGPFTLGVYSVATGAALRSWTGTDPSHGSYAYGSDGPPDPNANLTWTSDGQRLAFAYRGSKGPGASLYLREVNLARQGSDLFTDSTVVATIAVSTATGRSKIWCDSLGITGDGLSAVCGAEMPKAPPVGATLDALTEPAPWTGCAAPTDAAYPGLVKISLAGDRLAQVLYEAEPKCMGAGTATIVWSSPSGGTVLGAVTYTDGPSMTNHNAVVFYRHGTVTTVNWPGAASVLLANQAAF